MKQICLNFYLKLEKIECGKSMTTEELFSKRINTKALNKDSIWVVTNDITVNWKQSSFEIFNCSYVKSVFNLNFFFTFLLFRQLIWADWFESCLRLRKKRKAVCLTTYSKSAVLKDCLKLADFFGRIEKNAKIVRRNWCIRVGKMQKLLD